MKSNINELSDRTLNERQILNKFIFLFEITLYLLAFICFIYFISLGIKAKAIKCIIIVSLLLGYRFIQIIFNLKLHDLLKLSVLIFIFMAMFLAETLNFYSKIPLFDKILHSFSGIMLFFLGQALYKHVENSQMNYQNNNSIMILFSMFFSIAMAGCWEIFEFSLDRTMGYHLQKDSLLDTMGDIICGTSMAILSAVFSLVLLKSKKAKIEENFLVDEVIDEYPHMVSLNERSNISHTSIDSHM